MNKTPKFSSHWPLGICLFFLVVFAVNGTFLYLSIHRRPALVTHSPYEDSLEFQKKMDGSVVARGAFEHRIQSQCVGQRCRIEILLKPVGTTPVPETVRLHIQRGSTEAEILQLTVPISEGGSFIASHPALVPGVWMLEGEYLAGTAQAFFRAKHILRSEN